ncbi:MAG: nucleotidyltransferase family protein [Sporomusaceae bacterium]|jgi:predicted nucleotidyltransferase|nr:nucleotidyltransferase family protein [Sporomusaceae bacterium]
MTKVIGIIAEYNPFHNGHLWHLQKTLEQAGETAPYTVAVMSGSFVQRGEAAIFAKWARALMAVRGGIDLVLELPFVFAVRSAAYFAAGGVRLLEKLGVVSQLSFGAETADLALLSSAAAKLDCPDTLRLFRQKMKQGKTYAAALTEAAADAFLSAEFLAAPNNILAIEYLRALEKYAPSILPLAIKRTGAGHNATQITGAIASASAIRKEIWGRRDLAKILPAIPAANAADILALLNKGAVSDAKNLDNIILAKLRQKTWDALEKLPEVSEGLHYKIAQAALSAANAAELTARIKSKRYPTTRLQRIIAHVLLDTAKGDLEFFDTAGPLYARVLAFNARGKHLLKEMKHTAKIPIITKTAAYLTSKERRAASLPPLQAMLAFDTLATDVHALSMAGAELRTGGLDFVTSPWYLKN